MIERIAGDPQALEEYTRRTQATIPPIRDSLESYSASVGLFLTSRPNGIGDGGVQDRGLFVARVIDSLEVLDAKPATFAFALRELDRPTLHRIGEQARPVTVDQGIFDALVEAQLRGLSLGSPTGSPLMQLSLPELALLQAAPGLLGAVLESIRPWSAPGIADENGWLREVWNFVSSDLLSFWGGGKEGVPWGGGTAAAIRVARVVGWTWEWVSGVDTTLLTTRVPTFVNGFVGRMLSQMPALASLASPGSQVFFQKLGFWGGIAGGLTGTYKLIQQGNPIDAFERRGAGYVADVAQTAFNFSSAAFFAFPNPWTGGALVVTGVTWLGAEAWDHKEEIVGTAEDVWDFVEASGGAWAAVSDFVPLAWEGVFN